MLLLMQPNMPLAFLATRLHLLSPGCMWEFGPPSMCPPSICLISGRRIDFRKADFGKLRELTVFGPAMRVPSSPRIY
uniref:Uncharacterized protein n=1 Tax=Terrapene triunguis TaxID=2587831 RepID=A0A674JZD0_9SAUR